MHSLPSDLFPPSWLADPATPAWFLCVVAALVSVSALWHLVPRQVRG